MMTKLHKIDGAGHYYWEGWIVDEKVVFHLGTVGETGQRQTVNAGSELQANDILKHEIATAEANGFRKIDNGEMFRIVLNYHLNSWGSEEDLETRHYLEDLCDQSLGWTGNGHCDGGDIGSNRMNIWSFVLDVPAAIKTLSTELQIHGLVDGALLAMYDDTTNSYLAIWPDTRLGQVVEV